MPEGGAVTATDTDVRDGEREFDHVILTRFSVTFTAQQPAPDDAWLRYRLAFFIEACLASMARQSESHFDWLVFLDERTPQWLRDEMSALSADGLFEPVCIRGPFSVTTVRAAIEERATAPYLITTRLDSDDALGVRFVERVQAEFAGQDGLYVNALRGVQLDRSGRVYLYDYTSNPFISYIERRRAASPRTVFQDGRHGAARLHGPLLNLCVEPLWLQVVHGSNLANSVRGPRVSPSLVAASFDIDLGYSERVGARELLWEKLQQWVRLLLNWLRSPGLARQHVEAKLARARGTRCYPQRTPRRSSRA